MHNKFLFLLTKTLRSFLSFVLLTPLCRNWKSSIIEKKEIKLNCKLYLKQKSIVQYSTALFNSLTNIEFAPCIMGFIVCLSVQNFTFWILLFECKYFMSISHIILIMIMLVIIHFYSLRWLNIDIILLVCVICIYNLVLYL